MVFPIFFSHRETISLKDKILAGGLRYKCIFSCLTIETAIHTYQLYIPSTLSTCIHYIICVTVEHTFKIIFLYNKQSHEWQNIAVCTIEIVTGFYSNVHCTIYEKKNSHKNLYSKKKYIVQDRGHFTVDVIGHH